jgi:hypothetical protein
LTVLAALLLTLVAPSAFAQCGVVYTISPQNNTSFGAAITINNTGTTAWTGWTLTWTFANGQTISSLWNGNETQSGSNVTVTNESYNGSVPAGGSVTGMGFNGTWNGSTNTVPTNFAVNGVACNGGGGTGSFKLAPSAASLSVAQGASGTDTITVTDTAPFTGSVTLAASGLPAGVTATFGTNPATGSSAITFAASGTATVGTSTVTVTGTSGSLSATTTIALTVTSKGTGSFSLSRSAASLAVAQGASGTDTITVADVSPFAGSVTLAVSGLPAGVTAVFGTNPATSTSVLTLTASSTAIAGTSMVTITGTSGTLTASTTIALSVTATASGCPPGDAGTPTAIVPYISVSGTWTEESTATVASTTTVVDLGPQPTSGGTWAWTGPNGFTSTARQINSIALSVGANVYTATYTNASGCWNTQVFTVTVSGGSTGSFTLSRSAATLSVAQGTSGTDTITVADVSPFAGSVTLAASGLPAGVTAAFATNPTTGSSVLTLTVASTAAAATSTITITGTSGTLRATTTIALAVTGSPGGFTLKPSAAAVAIPLSCGNVTDTITVTDVSPFTGYVTLVASGLPSGVTATYGTNPTTTTSVLTFTASSTAAPGTSTVVITGTSGTLTASTTIAVTVTAAPQSFTLSPSVSALSIAQGGSGADTITVGDAGCLTGSTTLSASGLPTGVTASFATNPTTSTSVLTLTVASTATAATTDITVTGTSGALSATTTIALTVTTPSKGSFTISSSLSLMSVVVGSTATDTVLVTPVNGFTGSVTLNVSGLPSGVTGSWSVNPASSSSTLTLTASSTAPLGTYNVSITGTYGAISQTVGFEVAVTNATAISFTLSVASTTLNVKQNSGIADIVTVNDLNGFSGSVGFNISGLPSGVTPNFNPSTTSTTTLLSLAVGTTVTPGSYPVTIEGTSGSFAAGVNFTLNVSAGSPLNIAWVSPISATAGATVTILPGGSGDSFGATQGASAIYFGTTAATVTSWAVNSIQVTVPSLAAGTVNITAVVNGVTSNAVPFVIAAATPSPTVYNGNATHFGGTGDNAGGCGVPGNIQDTQNYVALNVQNDPGNYTLNLARPIVAPYLGYIGLFNNGLNCGRYLHVALGNACEGTNDGTADEPFCRDAADWVADQFNGAELDMVVQDSCQDGNAWCRDDPYHLDLNQNVIDDFLLNGTAVGDLFENWSNRQLIWYFEEAPNYTGDINIYVNQGSGPYATQVILTHLLNGLHGVNYYSNGAWHTGTMVSDNGSVYIILPTTTAGNQYQIQVYDVDGNLINSGRIYSFTLPSSCGTDCSGVTQVTYTTSSAN